MPGDDLFEGEEPKAPIDTPEFKKWFRESKVVDEDGAPKAVFHGTPNTGIVELTPENAMEVQGAVFFTDNTDIAEQYRYEREHDQIISERYDEDAEDYVDIEPGEMVEAYLSIQNPMVVDFDGDVGEAIRLGKLVKEAKAKGHDGLVIENVDDSVSGGDTGTTYAVFDPKQIKSTKNKGGFDPKNPDIRFMPGEEDKNLVAIHNTSTTGLLKALELGGIPVPSLAILKKGDPFTGYGEISLVGNRATIDPQEHAGNRLFESDVYTMRQPRPDYAINKQEVAKLKREFEKMRPDWHTLSPSDSPWDVVNHSKKGEGNKDQFINYAENSPMFRMAFMEEKTGKKIEPIMKRRDLYDGLVSETKAFQEIMKEPVAEGDQFEDYKPGGRMARAIVAAADEVAKKNRGLLGKELKNGILQRYIVEEGEKEPGAAKFGYASHLHDDLMTIQDNRQEVDRHTHRDETDKFIKANKEDFEQWIHDKVTPLFESPTVKVRGGKLPYTLENIVDAMTKRTVRGQEEGGMTKGLGLARSKSAREFKTVEQMKKAADRLVGTKEFQEAKEKVDQKFFAAVDQIAEAHSSGGAGFSFDRLDDASMALGDYMKRGGGRGGMRNALYRNYYKGEVSDAALDAMVEAANALKAMPTEYFEAKLHRGVKMEDFVGAAVPTGTPEKIVKALEEAGLHVEVYDRNKDTDRNRAVNVIAARKDAAFMPGARKTEEGWVPEYKAGMEYLHGGPVDLEGGKLKLGGNMGSDAGGIFLSRNVPEQRKYAATYDKGAIWKLKVNIPEDKIFDANNPDHIERVREVEGEDFSGEDFIRNLESSKRMNAMDWTAVDSQALEAAGFKGAILAERPEGFSTFKEDVYSLVVFDPEGIETIGKMPANEREKLLRESFPRPGEDMFMPGDETKRTWFVRGGRRVYHRRGDAGKFAPKLPLARMRPMPVSSDDDEKSLANFR